VVRSDAEASPTSFQAQLVLKWFRHPDLRRVAADHPSCVRGFLAGTPLIDGADQWAIGERLGLDDPEWVPRDVLLPAVAGVTLFVLFSHTGGCT